MRRGVATIRGRCLNRFEFSDTPLHGLRVVHRRRMGDTRGFLSRIFCSRALADVGWHRPVAQINLTHTAKRATLRGMHFQRPPHAEMKLVTCLRGEVWDVAVDLRAGSPTFLQWHAQRLSPDNECSMMIPEGFAHGFQSLSDEVELLYCHSEFHSPEAEDGVNPLDTRLGIVWPLPVSSLSERDRQLPLLGQDYGGIRQ
jgi:dTDP-4-dehydrorhamnose 3,5-epimerase